ncbi:MAG TPA: AAA family ATPase, partial [Salinimicrobium sp.]|nr:AAA family ATPase [Salinimicrobium sp.]
MITSLSIKNYALIEDIQVDLQEGFTVITGETGAGKSIMLGALNLLLGRRADLSSIRNPEKKCIIEGVFNIAPYHLEEFFVSEDLDYENQTIIRREILSSGKSRAFINDTPVRLNSLQVLGDQLIDIHGQHETLSLGKNEYQFSVIDILAGNSAELKKFRLELRELKKLEKELEQLKEEQAVAAREYDYNLFLLQELRQAGLDEGMQESLEERSGELENVEQLKEQLGSALNYLGQEQIGILDSLKEAKNNLQRISGISSSYEQLYQRLQSTVIELDDIASELENALEKVEADPKELEEINEKLQVLYDLQKKHQTDNISGLKEIEKKLSAKVSTSENAEEEISRINSEIF